MVVKYERPGRFIYYSPVAIAPELAKAKASVMALATIPYLRRWVEDLQEVQLKREVAGTSRIEGAEFTEKELEAALKETPEELITRSQRQARAAGQTYRWIAGLPPNRLITGDFIKEVHRRIVTNADDDHCPPGQLRDIGQNVIFGFPQHRGAEGGKECDEVFEAFCRSIEREYPDHDILIQALAMHYHLGAMHPFLDGNGRTARAIEAAALQKAGLKDTLIAMSNYYYDEKSAYLKTLSDTRAGGHDLTPFLRFGLKGIELQCGRLTGEIVREIQKALFRNIMYDLFNRLLSTRKRVIAKRQIELLKLFLEKEEILWPDVMRETERHYAGLLKPYRALVRDMNHLLAIDALTFERIEPKKTWIFRIRLDWPSVITETKFFETVNKLPTGKTHSFLG